MLFCSSTLGTCPFTAKESYCLKLFLCTMEDRTKSDSEESLFPENMATGSLTRILLVARALVQGIYCHRRNSLTLTQPVQTEISQSTVQQ